MFKKLKKNSPLGPPDVSQYCCNPELAHLIDLVKGLMISWQVESGVLALEYIKYIERLGVPDERFEKHCFNTPSCLAHQTCTW